VPSPVSTSGSVEISRRVRVSTILTSRVRFGLVEQVLCFEATSSAIRRPRGTRNADIAEGTCLADPLQREEAQCEVTIVSTS
jgi:hypothetical protein